MAPTSTTKASGTVKGYSSSKSASKSGSSAGKKKTTRITASSSSTGGYKNPNAFDPAQPKKKKQVRDKSRTGSNFSQKCSQMFTNVPKAKSLNPKL